MNVKENGIDIGALSARQKVTEDHVAHQLGAAYSRRNIIMGALAGGILIAALFLFLGNQKKIGYVRSDYLVYEYMGMKEARTSYEQKQQSWQASFDSLKLGYRQALTAYNQEYPHLSLKDREKREQLLQKEEQSLQQQQVDLTNRAKQEDQKMTQGVLNQINTSVQQYGKDHSFDLILATTQSGNILYGADALDLTNDLLAILNKSYSKPDIHADTAKPR